MHKFTYLKTLGLEKTLRNKFENKTKQINDNLFHHVYNRSKKEDIINNKTKNKLDYKNDEFQSCSNFNSDLQENSVFTLPYDYMDKSNPSLAKLDRKPNNSGYELFNSNEIKSPIRQKNKKLFIENDSKLKFNSQTGEISILNSSYNQHYLHTDYFTTSMPFKIEIYVQSLDLYNQSKFEFGFKFYSKGSEMMYGIQGDGIIYNLNPSVRKAIKIERNNLISLELDENQMLFYINGDLKMKAYLDNTHYMFYFRNNDCRNRFKVNNCSLYKLFDTEFYGENPIYDEGQNNFIFKK
eukprot:Mrub_07413.p1 GENE.Mrub_07413~~Mrub_07413.p1  ORF type:complete len:295 (+),score=38.40 Mrub_07413:2-886(+)